MKGFINKRDKIKWEDTPFQPEFTGEKIAEMVSGELSLDDLADVRGTSPIASGEPFLKYNRSTEKWEPGIVYFNDVQEVNVTTPANGQVLTYNSDTSRWENVTPAATPTWHALDPITADGIETTYEAALEDAVSIVVMMNVKQGSADDTVNFNASFDGISYPRIANIGNLIAAAGERWGRIESAGDGGLWRTVQTNAATAASSNIAIVTRNDTVYFNGSPMKAIRVSASSPLPENSTIQIYAKY